MFKNTTFYSIKSTPILTRLVSIFLLNILSFTIYGGEATIVLRTHGIASAFCKSLMVVLNILFTKCDAKIHFCTTKCKQNAPIAFAPQFSFLIHFTCKM